ncbi:MAG: hypothetical protein OQK12_07035 [Motiliproteus sp.]|nr:hypothetical protein [Motiliproteus sp.]MCW9050897.1 hypothetical protein [Motiliproteus sp.]
MKQQINLYVRREQTTVPLSAHSCLVIVGVSALLLAGVFAYNWQQQQTLDAEMATLKQRQNTLQQQYDQVQRTRVPKKESPELKQQLRLLDSEISDKKRFQSMLGKLGADDTLQFSSVLNGLAEQAVDGLWLTRIQSDTSARKVVLEGGALSADLLPRYIKGLGQERAYAGAQFDQLQLQQQETGLSFLVNAELQSEVVR